MIPHAAEELAKAISDMAPRKSGEVGCRDFISEPWSSVAESGCQTVMEGVALREALARGDLRLALGIAYALGRRHGEVGAFFNPAEHGVYNDVLADGGTHELKKSQKRRSDWARATATWATAITEARRLHGGEYLKHLPYVCDMRERLRKAGIPKRVSEDTTPDWWPQKPKPGRPPKPGKG